MKMDLTKPLPREIVGAFITALQEDGYNIPGLEKVIGNPDTVEYNKRIGQHYAGPRNWKTKTGRISNNDLDIITMTLFYILKGNADGSVETDPLKMEYIACYDANIFVADRFAADDTGKIDITTTERNGMRDMYKDDMELAAKEAMGDELGGLLDL